MKAIILAAGYATRLYPLTENMPKALLKVGGKTIIDHLLEKITRNDRVDEIHVISNHRFFAVLSEWAQAVTKNYPSARLTVWDDMTSSNDNRLGAIGDIMYTIDKAGIDDDLLVAASDNLIDGNLDEFFADFAEHGRDMVLAGRLEDREELKRFAVMSVEEGRITRLVEKPREPESDIVAYAIYLYRRDTIPLIRQYLREGNPPDAPGHFPEWLYKIKPMRACVFAGECVDIGTLEAYRATCEEWDKRR